MTDVPLPLLRVHRLPDGVIRLLCELAEGQGDPVGITLDILRTDTAWLQDVTTLFPEISMVSEGGSRSQFEGRQLPEIAVAFAVQRYIRNGLASPELSRYWQYILACGVACAELAGASNLNTALAFSCGLLHDLGRLALMTAYPRQYTNLFAAAQRLFARNEPINISAQEQILFGCDRFEAGEWLIDEWGLPPFFRQILGKFQSTGASPVAELPALTRTGCSLVYSFRYGLMLGAPHRNIREAMLVLPRNIPQRFGPDLRELRKIIDTTLERWPDLSQDVAERPAA